MKNRFPGDTRLAFEESAGVAIALCLAITLALVAMTIWAPSDEQRAKCNAACEEMLG